MKKYIWTHAQGPVNYSGLILDRGLLLWSASETVKTMQSNVHVCWSVRCSSVRSEWWCSFRCICTEVIIYFLPCPHPKPSLTAASEETRKHNRPVLMCWGHAPHTDHLLYSSHTHINWKTSVVNRVWRQKFHCTTKCPCQRESVEWSQRSGAVCLHRGPLA